MFGAPLLGGRIGDPFGPCRVFRAGVAVFTFASLLGGFAPDGASLIASRFLQGLGAALTAPNALALIRSTFAEGEARDKAIGPSGPMSGLGVVGAADGWTRGQRLGAAAGRAGLREEGATGPVGPAGRPDAGWS